jgi:hypothetical protein
LSRQAVCDGRRLKSDAALAMNNGLRGICNLLEVDCDTSCKKIHRKVREGAKKKEERHL